MILQGTLKGRFRLGSKINLIEQSESHVIIFLLFFRFLLLGSCCRSCLSGSWSSTSCWGSCCSASNRGELFDSGSHQLVNVLALDVLQNNVKVLLVSLDTDRSKNLANSLGSDLLLGQLK